MKRLASILFVASFAAFPLFAAEEEVATEETNKEKVTIDEVQKTQKVEKEVSVQEDQKDKETLS